MPTIRTARPDDHARVIGLVDDWWGRPIAGALPRLFFDHFHATSLVAEDADGRVVAFLVGFLSPSLPDEAYVHFVGVHPDQRRTGLARRLYERFFTTVRAAGRRVVRALTSPVNGGSIDFHRRLGFEVEGPVADYDQPGMARVLFRRRLD